MEGGITKRYEETFGMMDMFIILILMMVYTYIKLYTYVQFSICQFHLNKQTKKKTERKKKRMSEIKKQHTTFLLPFLLEEF